jgi:uncharacterized membrane protein
MSSSISNRLPWKPKSIARTALGVLFIVASVPHFIATDTELKTVPTFLPLRRTAVYLSGVFELFGGIGVFIPRFRRISGWGLAALLVAIFPANIYHAVRDIQTGRFTKMRIYHLLRGPLQILFVWWALWATGKEKEVQH